MPAQALYLRWRPRAFEHVIGQEHITRTLRNSLVQNRVRHAYLFNGPRGTGKTTMARILAKAVNCLHADPAQRPCDACQFCTSINEGRFLDLIEIDAASNNGVDDVRDLREKVAFSPSEGRYKVYIIDEVHRFSAAAFDALLKTLEEPPPHVIFVLATTELDKVPATIKSRSLIFEFRRVSLREVADRLQLIAESEKIRIDRDVLELVAQQGTGSVRDSISLLDQLIADPSEHITMEVAERILGTAGNRIVGKLAEAIITNQVAEALDLLNQAIDEGADPAQFGRQIVEYWRNLLLVQTGGPDLVDVSSETKMILQAQSKRIGRSALIRAIRSFNAAVAEVRSGWQPQLPLELAVIESTRPIQEEVIVVQTKQESQPAPQTKVVPALPPPIDSTPEPVTDLDTALAEPPPISANELINAWPEIMRRIKESNVVLGTQLDKSYIKPLDATHFAVAVLSVLKARVDTPENIKAIRVMIRSMLKRPAPQLKVIAADSTDPAQLDDTIMNDELIKDLSNAGGKVVRVENRDEEA